MTQRSLINLAYAGNKFHLEKRFATMFVTLLCCMAFSGGMPFLLPVTALSFGLAYWADKVAVLRTANHPSGYPPELAYVAIKCMLFALLVHLSVTIWMYGNTEVLSSDALNISGVTVDDTNIWSIATGGSGEMERLVNRACHATTCCHFSSFGYCYSCGWYWAREWDVSCRAWFASSPVGVTVEACM